MNIFTAVKIFFSILSFVALTLSFELFITYLCFFVVLNVCDVIMRMKKKEYYFIFQFIATCLIVIFYIRPLVLFRRPDFFQFTRNLGLINSADIINGLGDLTLYISFLLFFFCLLSSRDKQKFSSPVQQIVVFETSNILKKINYIINLILVLSGLRFAINVLLGVGIKGQLITSSAAFMVRFAPEEFIIGIALMLLFFYRKKMTKSQNLRIIVGVVFLLISFLATGSKAVFLLLIIFFAFIFMYLDIKIKLPRLMSYSFLVILIVPISFLLGNAVKFASYTGEVNVNNIISVFRNLAETTSIEDIINTITGRLIGFDGILAIERVNKLELFEIYSLSNTLQRSIGMLIPFVSSDLITSGEAVAQIVQGLPSDLIHAGAIGGLAGIDLISYGNIYLGIAIFVIFNIFIIRWHMTIRDPFSKAVFFFFYCFFLLFVLMSGNFDFCIAIYLIKIFLYKFYFYPVFKLKR